MSGFTDYGENKILDWLLRGQAFLPPVTLYVGLDIDAGTDAGAATECTGGGYARAAITAGLAAWSGTQGAGTVVASSGSSGVVSNNAEIAFPTPTGDWGRVVGFRLWDAPTGGNCIWVGGLAAGKNINAGDPAPSFAPGTLALSLD